MSTQIRHTASGLFPRNLEGKVQKHMKESREMHLERHWEEPEGLH